jgi:hypothetical protein
MKKVLSIILVCTFFASFAPAESIEQIQKELTRSGEINGAKISFIILDDNMLGYLYKESKDTIKAKLSPTGTALYFMGKAEKKDVKMDKLYVFQNEQIIKATIINSKIAEGQTIPKGESFTGILQLEKKLDFYSKFSVRSTSGYVDFNLNDTALRNIKN